MEPGPHRIPRNNPARLDGQNQERRLKRIVGVMAIGKDAAAHPP